jgi:BppU N-terminal domain
MQLNPVYLYPNKINVYLNLSSAWQLERYRNVYNRTLKLYRGSDNRVDFQVKNSDQKPIEITGYQPVFVLVNQNEEQILKKDAVVQSASGGKVYVILNESDLWDIDKGFYKYALMLEARTATADGYIVTERKPTYIDSQYGVSAPVEVFGDISGEPVPSVEVSTFKETRPSSVGEEEPTFFTSSLIDAEYHRRKSSAVHTFAFYMTNYSGEIKIEASLSEGGNPEVWTELNSFQVSERSDPFYHNVEGKYKWFRIKHLPNKIDSIADFTIQQTILGYYLVDINEAGSGYTVGDVLTIAGSLLGGETPTNDLTITVETVDAFGRILSISHSGVSYNGVRTYVLSGELSNQGTFDKVLYR